MIMMYIISYKDFNTYVEQLNTNLKYVIRKYC